MCEMNCGGRCCQRFHLWHPPEVLKKEYEKFLENGSSGLVGIDQVYPMLVYLGEYYYDPIDLNNKIEKTIHHYTCKHHDKETGLCTIYDQRPAMCSEYPYGSACRYPGCCSDDGGEEWLKRHNELLRG